MVVKSRTSKVKQNNKKRNKVVKQNPVKRKKSTSTIKTKTKAKPKKVSKEKAVKSSESVHSESDDGEDMLEMVEEEDIDFLKKAITNRSYSIFNKVRNSGPNNKVKRRKLDNEDGTLEEDYENQIDETKPLKNLLPIKTKGGVVPRAITVNEAQEDSEKTEEKEETPSSDDESSDEENFDLLNDDMFDKNNPVTTAQLLATRNDLLDKRKLQIGVLSAGVLENPDEKIKNIKVLFDLMEEKSPIYLTVRKLIVVSLLEVFKDLIPSYQIKHQNNSDVKLKKDTLKLQKYELGLLQYYKSFLQKLEKYCNVLSKRRSGYQKHSEEEKNLGKLAIKTLCDLLTTHPYFNYGQNIAQAVIPFLNASDRTVREIVKNACITLFKNDKKSEITLKVLRIVNHYLKNHSHNVNTDMLDVLLVLKLNDVNLDQSKEDKLKQKKYNAAKHKIIQMSKKEKKRKKRLVELEKEMLETKAEENKKVKTRNLTEMIKIVFGIYFRILKTSTNTKILGVCLEGLAKFAHCINMEYFVDLIKVLDNLLKEDWVGYCEKLHCIQTIFTILSGQGEALNLDPTRFYVYLYKDLLLVDILKNSKFFAVVLETLNSALVKRRKKITNKRAIAFVKRIATLSLQLSHNGSLSCLCLIKALLQVNRSIDILLDFDTTLGDGQFMSSLEDPEYCNASSTALFELMLLYKHYHPVVCKYAKHVAYGVPASGEGSLPAEFLKCTPADLFGNFDSSEMAFNPPVPVPKKVQPKNTITGKRFADTSFEVYCNDLIKSKFKKIDTFYIE